MPKYNFYNKFTGINKRIYFLLTLCFILISLVSNGKEKQKSGKTTAALTGFQDEEETNLLSDFKFYNIGENTSEGIITLQDSLIKIVASGTDFGGTNDEGFFIFQQIKGDFEFSVRVNALSPSELYAKAGIMARQDLTDDSKNIYFHVFPDNQERLNNKSGSEFIYRTKRGAEMEAIHPNWQTAGDKFNVNFPNTWIKLKREGDTFTAYLSSDNKTTWQQYATYTQNMARSLLVGLAITSHNPNGFTKAEFSDIVISE